MTYELPVESLAGFRPLLPIRLRTAWELDYRLPLANVYSRVIGVRPLLWITRHIMEAVEARL